MTLLSIRNLEVQFKHYEGVTTALKKISLDIKKKKFSDILKQLYFALKEGGILFFSLKRGVGESRDKLGRFYSYYEKSEVEKLLEKASFRTKTFTEGASIGLAGEKENWMGFFAKK